MLSQLKLYLFSLAVLSVQMGVASAGDFYGRVRVGDMVYSARLESFEADRYFQILPRIPEGALPIEETSFALAGAEILVPTVPTKIFGAVNNYRGPDYDPAKKPDHPQFFLKAPSSLLAHEGTILLPKDGEGAVYEGEMVVVIGKRATNVSVAEAPNYVFGVTCGNDVSGVGWEKDFQLWRAKGADTFGPCGPFIATDLNYNDLKLELRVDGEVRQQGRTSDMVFSVAEQVSFISQFLTLEPGDLLYTGTPGPIQPLNPGEVVEVELEGVGTLRNTVGREE